MSKHVQQRTTTDIIPVDEAMLTEAEKWVTACEHCAERATITLDYLLDALTECDPTTEYAMCRPAFCPSCTSEITETTLIVI